MAGSRWLPWLVVGVSLISMPACTTFHQRKLAIPQGQEHTSLLPAADHPVHPAGSPYHAEPLPLPGEFARVMDAPQRDPGVAAAWLSSAAPDAPLVRARLEINNAAPPSRSPPPAEPRPIAEAENTAVVRHPLVAALEMFLQDQPVEAMRLLQVYRPADQELLLRLMPLIARVACGGLLSEQLTAPEKEALIHTLQTMQADLEAASPLVIKNEGFCRRVRGFGQVVRLPGNQFRAGDQVLIYAEIQNLTDRKLKDQYVSRLGGVLEIHGPDCKVVQTQLVPTVVDASESPRRDHYIVIHFPVPYDLPAGSYTLRVCIIDQDSFREAEKFLPFRVLAASGKERQ
jgi:hypothetical protein